MAAGLCLCLAALLAGPRPGEAQAAAALPWAQGGTASAPQEGPDGGLPLGPLAADDECGAARGAGTTCGLSALQLRRGEGARSLASAMDNSSALVRGFASASSSATAEDLRSSRWGTCVNFGCASYVPRQRCQCNPQCRIYDNCCSDFSDTCGNTTIHGNEDERGPIMTLYHQTSVEIGPLILMNGFKPGRVGWCGGAIYFARSPQATITKASGINSHRGFMVEAVVSLGNVKHMGPTCDMSMTPEKLHKQGYDTIVFNPVDGDEFVIYNSSQVLSTRRFPFDWLR